MSLLRVVAVTMALPLAAAFFNEKAFLTPNKAMEAAPSSEGQQRRLGNESEVNATETVNVTTENDTSTANTGGGSIDDNTTENKSNTSTGNSGNTTGGSDAGNSSDSTGEDGVDNNETSGGKSSGPTATNTNAASPSTLASGVAVLLAAVSFLVAF